MKTLKLYNKIEGIKFIYSVKSKILSPLHLERAKLRIPFDTPLIIRKTIETTVNLGNEIKVNLNFLSVFLEDEHPVIFYYVQLINNLANIDVKGGDEQSEFLLSCIDDLDLTLDFDYVDEEMKMKSIDLKPQEVKLTLPREHAFFEDKELKLFVHDTEFRPLLIPISIDSNKTLDPTLISQKCRVINEY